MCGIPSCVPLWLGFKYFVVFFDDDSHMPWLFLIREQSEIFSIFFSLNKVFLTLVHALESENARDYLFRTSQSFFSSQFGQQQWSCSYKSQQNNVIERKNKHFFEIARAIRARIPLQFWNSHYDIMSSYKSCIFFLFFHGHVLSNPFLRDTWYIIHILFDHVYWGSLFGSCLIFMGALSLLCVFVEYYMLQKKSYGCYSPEFIIFVTIVVIFF